MKKKPTEEILKKDNTEQTVFLEGYGKAIFYPEKPEDQEAGLINILRKLEINTYVLESELMKSGHLIEDLKARVKLLEDTLGIVMYRSNNRLKDLSHFSKEKTTAKTRRVIKHYKDFCLGLREVYKNTVTETDK